MHTYPINILNVIYFSKKNSGDWSNGSVVKNSSSSYGRLEFSSQFPHPVAQLQEMGLPLSVWELSAKDLHFDGQRFPAFGST